MELEENVKNFENAVEMVRWAMTTAILSSNNTNNAENYMATNVIKLIFSMLDKDQFQKII